VVTAVKIGADSPINGMRVGVVSSAATAFRGFSLIIDSPEWRKVVLMDATIEQQRPGEKRKATW
jgi:hypothetical protein